MPSNVLTNFNSSIKDAFLISKCLVNFSIKSVDQNMEISVLRRLVYHDHARASGTACGVLEPDPSSNIPHREGQRWIVNGSDSGRGSSCPIVYTVITRRKHEPSFRLTDFHYLPRRNSHRVSACRRCMVCLRQTIGTRRIYIYIYIYHRWNKYDYHGSVSGRSANCK